MQRSQLKQYKKNNVSQGQVVTNCKWFKGKKNDKTAQRKEFKKKIRKKDKTFHGFFQNRLKLQIAHDGTRPFLTLTRILKKRKWKTTKGRAGPGRKEKSSVNPQEITLTIIRQNKVKFTAPTTKMVFPQRGEPCNSKLKERACQGKKGTIKNSEKNKKKRSRGRDRQGKKEKKEM